MEIVQIAQHVEDLDRAIAFYEDLLGQKVAARFDPPGLAFFMLMELLERLTIPWHVSRRGYTTAPQEAAV